MVRLIAALAVVLALMGRAEAQSSNDAQAFMRALEALGWQREPAVGKIGDIAELRLANGNKFLGAADSSKFIEMNGNPPTTNHYVLSHPDYNWFAVFTFDDIGYVKDDEKLDPDELLKSLKEQNEAAADERKRLNLPPLQLVGWAVPPHYDAATRRLEWGTKLLSGSGQYGVNYTVRILGRSGVMNAILVTTPETLLTDLQEFRTALNGYDFVAGQRYAEFKQGDKVAEYGLAALIIGGAAAAAAKSGIFKVLGKFAGVIGVAVIGTVGVFFRKFFKRKAA
jgi:uncharacterized membrane-anchored protein